MKKAKSLLAFPRPAADSDAAETAADAHAAVAKQQPHQSSRTPATKKQQAQSRATDGPGDFLHSATRGRLRSNSIDVSSSVDTTPLPDPPAVGAPNTTKILTKKRRRDAEFPTPAAGKGGKAGKTGKRAHDRAASLNFQSISVGARALCIVKDVHREDYAIVSLPHGLNAVVPRHEISDEPISSETPLHSLLPPPGSQLVCVVQKLEKNHANNRVEVSLRASRINRDCSPDTLLEPGQVVNGTVHSVEDHGYVVSFGVPNVSGFVPFSSAGGSSDSPALLPGRPVRAVVEPRAKGGAKSAAAASGRATRLLVDPSLVHAATVSSKSHTLSSLLPGMLVSARVKEVYAAGSRAGVKVGFLDFFTGSVDALHLPEAALQVGDEELARIIYVDQTKRLTLLSMAPHILSPPSPSDGLLNHLNTFAGAVVESALVKDVDPNHGLVLDLAARGEHADAPAAYVHPSKVSDDRKTPVKLSKSFPPGSEVRCRIVGTMLFENALAASIQTSVVEAAVLRYDELQPGVAVQGEVFRVDDFGVLVRLGQGVRAVVTTMHLADVPVQNPAAKFKEGQLLACRVLQVDAAAKKVQLTHKKTMVKTDLAVIASYKDATPGTQAHGFVTAAKDFGLLVTFYNNVHGLVPADALRAMGVMVPSASYQVRVFLKVFVPLFGT